MLLDLLFDFLNLYGYLLLVVSILIAAKSVFGAAYCTGIRKIKGIVEPPECEAFYGHLNVLGEDHATNLQTIGDRYNLKVFQVRFGVERAVILHTFAEGFSWFVKNHQSALIDRPLFYTFHKLVSNTQGLTVGTSPWDENCKRRRLAITKYMTRTALQKIQDLIDLESCSFVKDIWRLTCEGSIGVDPHIAAQRMSFNITTMLCYAIRFDTIDSSLLLDILKIVSQVSSFRSTNNNLQDYVPIYRYLPDKRREMAKEVSKKRDVWLNDFLNRAFERSEVRESFAGSMGTKKLSLEDLRSICVSLVSGGFETLASITSLLLAQLSTENGKEWQETAYGELTDAYGNDGDKLWNLVTFEEKCPFVVALIRETLRHYPVIPLCPPRKTTREFEYEGAKIPKGVTVILNCQAANHDKEHFGADADEFNPARWFDESLDINKPPFHFTFGAGSRACPGILLSHRALYATIGRMIFLFKIGPHGEKPDLNYKTYAEDKTAQTWSPLPFKISLEPRGPVDKFLNRDHLQHLVELSYEHI